MPPVGPWGLPRPPGLGSPRGNSGRSWLPSVKLHVSSPWGPRLASVAAAGRLGLGSKRGIAAGLATLLCLRLLQTGTDGAPSQHTCCLLAPAQLPALTSGAVALHLRRPHNAALAGSTVQTGVASSREARPCGGQGEQTACAFSPVSPLTDSQPITWKFPRSHLSIMKAA